MNKLLLLILLLASAGCNNLSPRDNFSPNIKQEIDNAKGKINGLETNQNSMKAEIGRLTQELTIKDSQIQSLQQGMLNLQNTNNGIQIFQGGGPMVFAFALTTIGMILYYFHRAKMLEKTSRILAQQIKLYGDKDLENQVLFAALNTEVERDVFKLIE